METGLFESLVREASKKMDGGALPPLTPEEQIARLRKAYSAYTSMHEFKPGQIVIGKKDCPGPMKDFNSPHIVVEVGCENVRETTRGINSEGEDRSLRVGIFSGETFNTYLVNPLYFEPYGA